MPLLPTEDEFVKLMLAVTIGAVVGAEREYRDKAAGFRTMTLICVGACLFTMASLGMGGPAMRDPARIAAQIVTGVGFLGAGVIVRDGGRVIGITTAATIWLTAALGMGIGGGFYGVTLLATIVVLATLWVLPLIERRIDERREERTYRIVCAAEVEHGALGQVLSASGLQLHGHRLHKQPGHKVVVWNAQGPIVSHDRACAALIAASDVREFTC